MKVLDEFEPDNPLTVGTALHEAIEYGLATAEANYMNKYPIATDEHYIELYKISRMLDKVKNILTPGGTYEVELKNKDFKGFVDYVYPNSDGTVSIIDFKYSNNIDIYKESEQIHLYKYYYELVKGVEVKELYYLMIPKVSIKQKKGEDLQQFYNRLDRELSTAEPTLLKIEYNPNKVISYLTAIKTVLEAKEYPKNESRLCRYCEYKDYCLQGDDTNVIA